MSDGDSPPGMYVPCECGNNTFHIKFEIPGPDDPIARKYAECTECGEWREIGGDGKPSKDTAKDVADHDARQQPAGGDGE